MKRFLLFVALLAGMVMNAANPALLRTFSSLDNPTTGLLRYNPNNINGHVVVESYWEGLGKGGGEFVWVAGSNADTNTFSCFKSQSTDWTSGLGRWIAYFADNEFDAARAGARGDWPTTPSDNAAIQNIINTLEQTGSFGTVKVPHGTYGITNLIIAKTDGVSFSTVSGIRIIGEAPTSSEAADQVKFVITDGNGAGIIIQQCDDCAVENINFVGKNSFFGEAKVDETDFAGTFLTFTNFISSANTVSTNRYAPHAAIVIDPFSSTAPSQYPGLAAWYVGSTAGSTSVKIKNNTFTDFYAGFVVSPGANVGGVHRLLADNNKFLKSTFGPGFGTSLIDFTVRGSQFRDVFTAFSTENFGNGTGQRPYIDGAHAKFTTYLFQESLSGTNGQVNNFQFQEIQSFVSGTSSIQEGTLRIVGSGYTDTGVNFLSDDGTYKAAGAAINPTDGYVPYRSNSTSFSNSPWYRISTNRMGFNGTNFFLFADSNDIGIGAGTLTNLTTGVGNVAIGGSNLRNLTSGSFNTALGFSTLPALIIGDNNIAIKGGSVLTNGTQNIIIGTSALLAAKIASDTVAIGIQAGVGAVQADKSVLIGSGSLGLSVKSVTNSVVIGTSGGISSGTLTNVVGSVIIGNKRSTYSGPIELTNSIAIGDDVVPVNSNEILIGNTSNTKVIFPITTYTGTGTNFLSDDGTFKAGSGGGTSDNWTASGTTNSTLPGVASLNALNITNSIAWKGTTNLNFTISSDTWEWLKAEGFTGDVRLRAVNLVTDQANWLKVTPGGAGDPTYGFYHGVGSPNSVQSAGFPSIYFDTGTTATPIWVKTNGTGNTGWSKVSNLGGGGGSGDALVANPLSQFAATTSAQLASTISDELNPGSGNLIFSPGTLNVTAAKTLAATASLTLSGTDSTTMTFPSTTATIARTDAAQTFTGTQSFGVINESALNTITLAGVAATPTDGLTLSGSDVATVGAQKYSPAKRLHGSGWKTTATAGPQDVDFREYLQPVQGSTAPTANILWDYSVNGGAFANRASLSSAGKLIVQDGSTVTAFLDGNNNGASPFVGMAIGGNSSGMMWNGASAVTFTLNGTAMQTFNGAVGVTFPGTFGVTGKSTLTGGIVGKTDASDATAGNVGEVVTSAIAVGSAVSLTTATAANITTISLTAGDWDVFGNVNFSAATATVTGTSGGISTTSATLPTDGTEVYSGVQVTLLSEIDSVTLPLKRVNVNSTTTVYLVGKSTFSAGTVTGFGSITARRVR